MALVLMLTAFSSACLAALARARCANSGWTDAYSPDRCHVNGDTAVVQCLSRSGAECGMRMESTFNSGIGLHTMGIKAAPGPGVVTTFYLSNNGGLYDKSCTNPWVELDYEIMGNQVGPQSRIWTNLFTGTCQEHWQWITVPFDASAGYHTYAFNITQDRIAWVVDGVAYRTESILHYGDVQDSAQSSAFRSFVSVWGKSSNEPGEGIPQFQDALGKLDHNTNAFPVRAGFKRDQASGAAPSPSNPASPGSCAHETAPWQDCHNNMCCTEGYTCFEKDFHYAQCRPSCTPGVHQDDLPQHRTPWSCAVLSSAPIATPAPSSSPVIPVPTPNPAGGLPACPDGPRLWGACQHSKCCADGSTCFEKDDHYAQCRNSCARGVHEDDLPGHKTPWSCAVLSSTLIAMPAPSSIPVMPVPTPRPAGGLPACPDGPRLWDACQQSKCCADGSTCFEKDVYYAQCRNSCTRSALWGWSCAVLSPARRLGSALLV